MNEEKQPWWERVSDPNPKVREEAHKEAEEEADDYYKQIYHDYQPETEEE
jgi:hypothetical protein